MASRGLVWVDYWITFKADKKKAEEAFAFMQTLDIDGYDYQVGDVMELTEGKDGTWFIEYGAESYEEGPGNDFKAKFPELNADVDVASEHYD